MGKIIVQIFDHLDFNKYEEFIVDSFTFPDHAVQTKVAVANTHSPKVRVKAQLQDSEDIVKLLFVVETLKHYYPLARIEALIPYFPYARQDRRCNVGEAHGLKVMCNLINSLNLDRVIICDPHSDVIEGLLNNSHFIRQEDLVKEFFQSRLVNLKIAKPLYLISPDAGALKKIYKCAEVLGPDGIITAQKVRDLQTGKIIETSIVLPTGNEDFEESQFLVIDDIIDGGATFVALGQQMALHGVKKENCHLYVTHGIFSKGVEEINKYYGNIYTTNSFRDDLPESLTVLDIYNI